MDLDGANFRLWKFASAGVPFKGPRLRASQPDLTQVQNGEALGQLAHSEQPHNVSLALAGLWPARDVCLVSTADICPVSTADIHHASAADISSVAWLVSPEFHRGHNGTGEDCSPAHCHLC